MAYVKAVIGAVIAGLLVGAATGMVEVFTGAMAKLRPEDKAVVYGYGLSEAVNCAALFVLVLVPLTVIFVFFVRRWRRRSAPGTSG